MTPPASGSTLRDATAEHDERTWDSVTTEVYSQERYKLFRLCRCEPCEASGRQRIGATIARCRECRGEGRTLGLVATAATPEAVGLALVTLGLEGEWDECPVGLLDTEGDTGRKWLVKPWGPSARNFSDAGRLLRSAQTKGEK